MYVVAIVDDREDEIRLLKHCLKPEFSVIKIKLNDKLSDTIKDILDNDIDAIIVDYQLSGTNSLIHFKGDKVVESIRELKKLFPISVLTAYSEQAEQSKIDPDIVYDKEKILSEPEIFKRKLGHKIENYKNQIDELKKELMDFSYKNILTLKEEERILELDKLLEQELDNKNCLPIGLKTISNQSKLQELISISKNIIEEMNKEDE